MDERVIKAVKQVSDMKMTEAFYALKDQGDTPTITVYLDGGKPRSVILKVGPVDFFFSAPHESDDRYVFPFDGWGMSLIPAQPSADA